MGRREMVRLLSVNVGLPRDVSWRGDTVHTSVWKDPVQDRRLVRRLNVDGDGQGDLAVHGGKHRAVLVRVILRGQYMVAKVVLSELTRRVAHGFENSGSSLLSLCLFPAFHKEISRQDRLEATIGNSVDPLHLRFCSSSGAFPFPK